MCFMFRSRELPYMMSSRDLLQGICHGMGFNHLDLLWICFGRDTTLWTFMLCLIYLSVGLSFVWYGVIVRLKFLYC
jgi:hypothetical protein